MSSNVVALESFLDLPDHARLLGLDLGTKTIGLALSDLERQIATPLETIRRVKFSLDVVALVKIAEKNGAILRTNAAAEKIIVESGKAKAVIPNSSIRSR